MNWLKIGEQSNVHKDKKTFLPHWQISHRQCLTTAAEATPLQTVRLIGGGLSRSWKKKIQAGSFQIRAASN